VICSTLVTEPLLLFCSGSSPRPFFFLGSPGFAAVPGSFRSGQVIPPVPRFLPSLRSVLLFSWRSRRSRAQSVFEASPRVSCTRSCLGRWLLPSRTLRIFSLSAIPPLSYHRPRHSQLRWNLTRRLRVQPAGFLPSPASGNGSADFSKASAVLFEDAAEGLSPLLITFFPTDEA